MPTHRTSFATAPDLAALPRTSSAGFALGILCAVSALAAVAPACSGPSLVQGDGVESAPVDPSTADGPFTLTLIAVGVRAAGGEVAFAVYDDPDAFPDERERLVANASAPAEGDRVQVEIELPPGNYGAVLLHDEDLDGEMDTNALGLPQEGYGSSRNQGKRLGPPLWEDAVFPLGSDTTLEIEVLY